MAQLSNKSATGYKGIKLKKNRYSVHLYRYGRAIYIGSYRTLDAAKVEYDRACELYPPNPRNHKNKDNKRSNYPYPLIRDYTKTSDVLIVTLLNEEKMDIEHLARFINRDTEDLRLHIDEMKQSGRFDRIHNLLIRQNGVYARRLKKPSKRGQIA